ncbi:MAG: dihydrolipoamide acetyltransferase [Halomonadaceae bacterium]|nr:dihydrolipoamide acetyltransferase [Halomonadaceae bacterium]
MSDFMLPDIGEGIVECEVVKWLVSEGDVIEEDQPVAEVMTDKALVEIPAPYHGRVTQLYYQEGDIAKVHAPLFALVGDESSEEGQGESEPGLEEERAAPDSSHPERHTAADKAPTPREHDTRAITPPAGAVDFILPDIGEGIVECEIVEWRIQEGDEIAEDQPVVDVMTDKALVEITAPEAGRVSRLYYQQGEHARVHSPLFAYHPEDSSVSAGPPAAAEPQESRPQESRPNESRQPGTAAAGAMSSSRAPQQGRANPGQGAFGRIPASPAVRRLVREHALSLADIPGSGKQGRVLKDDVLRFLEQGADGSEHRQAASTAAPAPSAADETTAVGEVCIEPLKGVQAVMARRMVASASTIPHFAYGDEIDVTELLALRERLKPDAEALGVRLTLMPFFMKALALAVQEFPILNSRLNDEVTEIHYQSACNIGMAVDSRVGLIVPNVKGVERKSLLAIAGEIARLTQEAREGRVQQADLKGGTISISNIGALGGPYATPIINAPEVAIVAIGKTQQLPRFDAGGQVVSRAIMTATWSGDHRLIDGGTIARFVNRWKGYLESPQSMMLHLG